MASSSLHYFVLSKEKRSKEILEWCLDGILLIPLSNIRIFQEIQHRACQSFILEKIHHLDSGPTLPPALPTVYTYITYVSITRYIFRVRMCVPTHDTL
jgi:hypothetical protein